MTTSLRFDDALATALHWAHLHRAALGGEVHLVRDVHGYMRVLPAPGYRIEPVVAEELASRLGPWSPGARSIELDRAFFADAELASDRCRLDDGVWLVDRLVTEQGWRRAPAASPGHKPRITFFGVKGGVGRSTALVAVARRLAERGLRVLVVDLDLESPGATSMLLRAEELPHFGVVDWFVEDGVGQGDDDLVRAMVAPSRVSDVLVAPALGTTSVPNDERASARDGAFVAKLGRAYASPDGMDFATRLERLLRALERVHRPDVVLLDSRAGMHDISAAAVPRLGGAVLLFASATSQTWLGLRLLFSAWGRDREVLDAFRTRLQMVAAQVPETGREDYLERLRLGAWDLFRAYVYDAGDEAEGFTFDLKDVDAPHAPLPVYWRRELVEWEPAGQPGSRYDPVTAEQFEAAFAPFLRGVLELPGIAELLTATEAARDAG
jgi:hypothetical protein